MLLAIPANEAHPAAHSCMPALFCNQASVAGLVVVSPLICLKLQCVDRATRACAPAESDGFYEDDAYLDSSGGQAGLGPRSHPGKGLDRERIGSNGSATTSNIQGGGEGAARNLTGGPLMT